METDNVEQGVEQRQPIAARPQIEYAITALLGIASVAIFLGASNVRIPPTANVVDPRFFPRIVAGLLAISAIAHGVEVSKGRFGEPEEGEDVDLSKPGNWRALLAVSLSFIAHALLVQRVGWILAGIVLFFGSALGLGSKRIVRTLGISVVISVVAFIVFRVLLGVYLPGGPFETWIP
jgi:putative tricarboxylic transport membrane protein